MIKREQVPLITPTLDRVLVERIMPEVEVTESGIILSAGNVKHAEYKPNSSGSLLVEKEQEEEENLYEIKVLAVGPTCVGIKAGDKALVNKYAGLDIFKDRSVLLINEKDIVAVLGEYRK